MEFMEFVVNGTLMRGLALEENLLKVRARFLREGRTEKCYRLWSVRDEYPAMIRVGPDDALAVQVEVEVWEVPCAAFTEVLAGEPEGLSVGRVRMEDGRMIFGVIGEPELEKGMKEISRYGGWRNYIAGMDAGKAEDKG